MHCLWILEIYIDLHFFVSQGMSGRALRKLPFLAHIAVGAGSGSSAAAQISVQAYLLALHEAAMQELADRKQMYTMGKSFPT